MFPLPTRFAPVILPFAGLFRQRTWRHARALLIGAILAPGVRTVTSVLRILGLARDRRWVNYHRVLSRAVWSPHAASRLLLGLLVRAFVPTGPVLVGLDDTIERRRGQRIRAKGIYRDPVRSSHSHFVKASGLRWLSVMLLAPIPWARRVWALPFLTALAPSARYSAAHRHRHKTLLVWARQLLRQVRRWLPGRSLIVVADSNFAAIELLAALRPHMTCITRLRLDARLFTPAPPRRPGTVGRPRVKGERLPTLAAVLADPATRWERVTIPGWYGEGPRAVDLATGTGIWHHPGLPVIPLRWVLVRDPDGRFDPQALLATDPVLTAEAIVGYYVRRWQVEVTFEETRRHLGVETPWTMLQIGVSSSPLRSHASGSGPSQRGAAGGRPVSAAREHRDSAGGSRGDSAKGTEGPRDGLHRLRAGPARVGGAPECVRVGSARAATVGAGRDGPGHAGAPLRSAPERERRTAA